MKNQMIKRLTACIIALTIGFTVCQHIYADERTNDGMLRIAVAAHECYNNIKQGGSETEEIHAFDFNGEEITDRFITDTRAYFISGNMDAMSEYCRQNIQKMYRISDVVESKGLDEAKTRTMEVIEAMSSSGYYITVDYKVRGTIYYNPNTYKISSASTPIRTSLLYVHPNELFQYSTTHEVANSTIASNHLSATLNYSFKVKAITGWNNPGTIVFGTTSTSFTITPN